MKNLSTIPSFFLFGAITILITIVVCLAGFAGAEIPLGYKTNENYQSEGKETVETHSQPQEKIVNSQQTSNSRGDDDELSEQKNFASYFKNLQREGNFGQQLKRHLENRPKDLTESESDADNEGYEYNDDEYYHFDIKREGDIDGADEARESEKKEGLTNNKVSKTKNDKEDETIEMLNFSQTRTKTGASDVSLKDKTSPCYSQSDSLKMSDLKQNSGISEKAKNTKEESDTSANSERSSDQKLLQPKKEDSSGEEKDSSKLKDTKIETDSAEKKESDANIKSNSDNLTSKNVKDSAKSVENKAKVDHDAKPAKLKNEENSGEESSEKSSLKDSKGENEKLIKGEKDTSKLTNKLNSEDASKSEMFQNDNKANLVGNDFKGNGKLSSIEEEDKDSEEMNDKNIAIPFYQEDVKQRKEANENFGQNQVKNFELLNEKQRNMEGMSRARVKDIFTFPIAFEIKNENVKDTYKNQDKIQESRIEQPVKNSFRLNFPPSDLENTEYHKNFMKSLRRYKGLDDSIKTSKDGCSAQKENYYPPLIARGNQPLSKRSNIRKRKSKIDHIVENQDHSTPEAKKNSRSVEDKSGQGTSNQKLEKNSLISKKNENQQENNRRRRKSPQKFEYKIRIINEPTSKNSISNQPHQKRKKKDIKFKMSEGKSLKKSPYSQVLLEDLTKFNYQKNDKSVKRRKSTWLGEGQFKTSDEGEQGIFKVRGLPSGYYTNRVKFGNKHFLHDEESQAALGSFRDGNWLYENSLPLKASQSSFQRSWGMPKVEEMYHDPAKRFAGNNIFNSGRGNSLLLVKKGRNGERITKTFMDETKEDSQKNPESEELARILSQDSDYIVLKKTDSNKYQKISLDNLKDRLNSKREYRAVATNIKSYNFPVGVQEKIDSGRRTHTRLYRSSDQKSHSPSTISTSLKKTFEKFKDLADFFKDSEQETQENQQQTQELKEGSDIVFSEDKLPDPLVINNEVDEKNPKFKSQNSITSISTNFKQLDQDKKDECKDLIMDSNNNNINNNNGVLQWKPALKNAFPEAKSVSSVMKDGKEIILIDLNKNELMMNHKGHNVLGGSCGSSDRGSKPLIIPGNRQVEIIWNANPNPTYLDQTGAKNVLDKKYPLDRTFDKLSKFPEQEGNTALSGQPLVTMPLNDLAQLSILLKQLNERKESVTDNHNKILRKKSVEVAPTLKTSSNIAQFLKDYRILSEINNEQLSKKINVAQKRDSNSFSGISPELPSFANSNEKELLETPLANKNQKVNGFRGEAIEENGQGFKGWENEERKSSFSNSEKFESNLFPKRQGQWSSAKESRYYVPFKSAWNEYNPKELRSNLGNIFHLEKVQGNTNEKDYQEELLEELSEASNKIERLRREGADEQSLRETMEKALPFKGARKSESNQKEKVTSESKLTHQDTKDSSASLNEKVSKVDALEETPNIDKNAGLTTDVKKDNEKDLKEESQTKEIHENKPEPLQKNDKDQLRELFENVNFDNFELNELVRTRDGTENEQAPIRRKRSAVKVSTTEIENTIVSNFTEDIYHSIYSPGIKRKLLSINDNDADRYYKTDRRSKICEKYVAPDCNDPVISNCLNEQETQKDTNRAKRSLAGDFHSNHKREIDLDESMPNDFQNFLETSLGLDSHVPGIGGQKKEAFKKEKTRRENKEIAQGENTPISDISSGKKVEEDFFLEKREISETNDGKDKSFKERSSYNDFDNKMGKTSSQNLKIGRLQDKSEGKLGSSNLENEKLPTQIRIQITKDTAKDNKAEKPILDESDITSDEMENPSKEKEFFEKSKFHLNNMENLYSTSKFKNPYSADYGYDESDMDFKKQQYYMMAHPFKKKKKRKFVQENSHISASDVQLNQKIKDDLMRKYVSDRNLYEATTQRVPVSNHLPQVETVYNPTQGANKAQVQRCGLSLKENKDSSNKNNLQSQEGSVYKDKLLKFYVNNKHNSQFKSFKDEPKDLESIDWKPYAMKMKIRQNSDQGSAQIPNYKSLGVDSAYSNLNSRLMSRTSTSQLKQLQKPYNRYVNSYPSAVVMNLDTAHDSEKQKPDYFWNALAKETSNSKLWKDASYNYDSSNIKDSTSSNGNKFDDTSWKEYNSYYTNRNPNTYKFRNYISSSVVNALSDKSLNSQKYLKPLQENTANSPDSSNTLDNLKGSVYLENIEDQYSDNDDVKQDAQIEVEDHAKKENKLFTPDKYQKIDSYKVSDEENNPSSNNAREEVDEDYEGNNEEDWDDYSLLLEQEKAKKTQDNEKILNSYHGIEPLYPSMHHKPDKLQQGKGEINQGELKNNKKEEKLSLNAQGITYTESAKEGEAKPLWDSLNVLKVANENSNILGKNLMKNLQKYNYDASLRNEDKLQNDKSFIRGSKYPYFKEKEKLNSKNINWPNKFKRSHGLSKVGNRYIYATKTESFNLKDFEPKKYVSYKKNVRCSHYQLPKGNPLSAELRDTENEFEYESEDNNKYFDENLLNAGKGNFIKEGSQLKNGEKEFGHEKSHEKIKRNSFENTVKENLRDGDETLSENSVLENVIGKYIMRKSVKISPDRKVKNNGFEPVGMDKKKIESSSEDFNFKHKPEKRSVTNENHLEKQVNLKKNRGKRFSAGHLTENNYRKFHKKNLSRKRRLLEEDIKEFVARKSFKDRSRRCGRGVFRKISKAKENKKIDFPDSKTAGFEPILWDIRGEKARNAKEEANEKSLYNSNSYILDEKVNKDNARLSNKEKTVSVDDEKSSTSQVLGPWKIRLNEKNVKVCDQGSKQSKTNFDQNQLKENSGEALSSNGVQAYFLIRNNVRAAESKKMSEEDDFSPTSGTSEKEVGNSYRLFHEEGEKIPRKRSERSSSAKDRLIALVDNSISLEKLSKDLKNKRKIFEGNSKDGALFDGQKNANFVNVQGQRLRFGDKNKILSNGRLRKSVVLPLSTDANIIGDNRHINEETSKNLGQQIVEAILTHVSTNPRFRQVIAPGLSGKSPTYRQTLKSEKSTSTKIKYPDQVQSFLQTLMHHIEKMAENDVKKRMCNKIDRQSKDFLRSMLEFPEISSPRSCKQKKGFFVDPPCPEMCPKPCAAPYKFQGEMMSTTTMMSLPALAMPPPLPIGTSCGPALKASICEALKKKKEVLKKLIEDYQRLSELEREAINISFQFLVAQLEDTEQLLEFLNGCGECYHPPDCPPTENNLLTSTEHSPYSPNQELTQNIPLMSAQVPIIPSSPNIQNNPNMPNLPPLSPKNFSHVFHFEPDECAVRNTTSETMKQPCPQSTTVSSSCCMSQENADGGFEKVNSNEPQSFDLLPNHTSNSNLKPMEGLIRSRNIDKSESARIKDSFFQKEVMPANVQKMPISINKIEAVNNNEPKQSELHKLGIGDAAGIQMPHDHSSPWVSNLDVAKQKKPTNENGLLKSPNRPSFPKAIKNYRSSKNEGGDSIVKDSDNKKTQINKDLGGLSDNSKTNIDSELKSPNIQFQMNHFSGPSVFEGDSSNEVKKIRTKRRTMRYNVKRKKKRNIIHNKIRKLINQNKENSEYEEDPEMEYLIWASMPAVRRRLNDLEQGIEVDKNSAQLLMDNIKGERAEKEEKEKIDRLKFLGLKK